MTAYVRGRDEDEGYRVAVRWCELQGFRPPARVFPFIAAGPEILSQVAPNPIVPQTVIRGPLPEPMVR